MCTHHNWDCA